MILITQESLPSITHLGTLIIITRRTLLTKLVFAITTPTPPIIQTPTILLTFQKITPPMI